MMRSLDLKGKIGIVTGGCSGIGRAVVEALAEEGAIVVIFDLTPENAPSGAALVLNVDVSNASCVSDAFEVVDERFGRLDFLVNNAGIDIETLPSDDWLAEPLEGTIGVNLNGVYHCMRNGLSRMRRQRSGSIVNIGSIASLVGVATRPAYGASKHAIVGLTRTAGIQFGADNVRTNIVCPGGTRTDLLEKVMADNPLLRDQIASSCPMRRLAEPSEIADVVVWLVSSRSSFVNGAVIPVDGGLTAG